MRLIIGFLLCGGLFQNICGTSANDNTAPHKAEINQQEKTTRQSPPVTRETVTINQIKFNLEGCKLSYESKQGNESFDFGFPGECQFSKDAKSKIRQFKSGKNVTVLAVENSKEKSERRVSSSTIDCETYIRGVVVKHKSVLLSTQTQRVSACLPQIWDESMFAVFANKTQTFAQASKNQKDKN